MFNNDKDISKQDTSRQADLSASLSITDYDVIRRAKNFLVNPLDIDEIDELELLNELDEEDL